MRIIAPCAADTALYSRSQRRNAARSVLGGTSANAAEIAPSERAAITCTRSSLFSK
jgi:hypothetical protein